VIVSHQQQSEACDIRAAVRNVNTGKINKWGCDLHFHKHCPFRQV
jgi:hypothetical protein